jgi:DNA polymerase I-like protein with 3'-5' exonuclease and polymerase domains
MMRIALDIETDLSHKKIHLVNTKDLDTGELLTWKEAKPFRDFIRAATLIVAHNGIGFDFPVLNRQWNTKISLKKVYDTLIASRLLDPSRMEGHSLEAWGRTLGHKKVDYKKIWEWMVGRREEYDGECFDKPVDSLLEYYCARDVEVCARLYNHLVVELESKGFSKESIELEHKVAAIVAEQERNGFKLSVEQCTLLLVDWKNRISEILGRAQELYPPTVHERYSEKTGKRLKDTEVVFNMGSRQQIAQKLMELGWKPKKHTEKGSIIIDEAVLDEILGKHKEAAIQELASLVKEYLLLQKRIGQVESWLEALKPDGRVHGKVITNGAVTGRMTHSSPNMAQIPNAGSVYGPECRQCWTVDEGNVLVGCDASGLELRMLAHYMKDEGYVRTICEGSSKDRTDVHSVNQRAAELATRDNAKTFIYAFLYGAGDSKIGSIVGGSAKDGAKLKSKFLAQTPALASLLERVQRISSKGYVPGLDGRLIWVRSEHAALNSLLQGAGAIVMKKALCIFYDKIKANKWPVKLVANVHDEFQFECPKEIAEEAGKAARMSIIEAGEFYQLRCPLDGEYKIGKNWKETH